MTAGADINVGVTAVADTGAGVTARAVTGAGVLVEVDTEVGVTAGADTRGGVTTGADTGMEVLAGADTGEVVTARADTGVGVTAEANTGVEMTVGTDTGGGLRGPPDGIEDRALGRGTSSRESSLLLRLWYDGVAVWARVSSSDTSIEVEDRAAGATAFVEVHYGSCFAELTSISKRREHNCISHIWTYMRSKNSTLCLSKINFLRGHDGEYFPLKSVAVAVF